MLDTIFLWVLNMSIRASYVIFVVLLVRVFLKKAPKKFSYALWSVILFRLICPFSFESAISLLPINETPIPQDIVYSTEPQINTGFNLVDNVVNPMLPSHNNPGESIDPLQIWIFVGSVIWVIGIITMSIYSIIQFVRLKRKLIGSTPMQANIYLADHISSPFVMGFIKPKIYLPTLMTETEQEFIIAHEQYHIKRLDHIARILAFIALAIHWFNPLAWLAFVLSGKDMEISCDEAVMKKMDTDIRAEYAQSLLHFATGKKFIAATPLSFGESDTKERIKNVMKYKKPMLWVSIIAVITVIFITVGLMSNPKVEPIPKETNGVSIENLWKNRTEYVGDNSAVGNILSELSFPDNMQYKNFELKTKEQPYEIIVHFDGVDDALKTADYGDGQTETVLNIDYVQLEENSRIMFSLIGNVEIITFSVNGIDSGTLTNYYMRNKYDELFTKTATYKEFQNVLDDIIYNRNINNLVDFEAIIIGTEKDKIREQFGEPNGTLSGMHGDVYVVGDKRIIIYYGLDGEGNYPVTDVKIDDYIPKSLTHDQAVALALTSTSNRYLGGECIAEGHIILGYDDSDANKTKIYALTMTGWYGFENNNFVKVSGSGNIPAIVTLDSNNAVEIEYPLDGGGYRSSIEKMFPKEYHARIFGTNDNLNSDHDELTKQEQQYAKVYLSKIGRDAKIGNYSDFEYTQLNHAGVSVEASNNLEIFYKEHNYYPNFIGTYEDLENGTRMVYETSYHKNQDEIRFTKYYYDTKEIVEQFTADAKTGEIIT